mmetsp:Transcript_51990/g.143956  ORF Transcript_51990/g.143956 Transcript_51990/m.143956 type:complete len:144 (+) Transcript_51990:485-916(+)
MAPGNLAASGHLTMASRQGRKLPKRVPGVAAAQGAKDVEGGNVGTASADGGGAAAAPSAGAAKAPARSRAPHCESCTRSAAARPPGLPRYSASEQKESECVREGALQAGGWSARAWGHTRLTEQHAIGMCSLLWPQPRTRGAA